MCNYCLINQNELPVLFPLPSPAASPESFPSAQSSSPLISVNQNTASSEVGISCFPSLEVIWSLFGLPEHWVQIFVCVLFCFVLFLRTGHILACTVLTDVLISSAPIHPKLLDGRTQPCFSLQLPPTHPLPDLHSLCTELSRRRSQNSCMESAPASLPLSACVSVSFLPPLELKP